VDERAVSAGAGLLAATALGCSALVGTSGT